MPAMMHHHQYAPLSTLVVSLIAIAALRYCSSPYLLGCAVQALAQDAELAKRLWEASEELLAEHHRP